jgi:hypothetical protein
MFEIPTEHYATSLTEQRLASFVRRAEDMLGRDLGDRLDDVARAIADGCCVIEFVLDEQAREVA